MNTPVEQAWANRVKVLRAAVRLKHSIDADNELNALVDEERKFFDKEVQLGRLPAPLNPRKALAMARKERDV